MLFDSGFITVILDGKMSHSDHSAFHYPETGKYNITNRFRRMLTTLCSAFYSCENILSLVAYLCVKYHHYI